MLFLEPRGKEDKLETVLKSYYGSVHGNNTLSSKKIKKGQKRVVNQLSTEPFKNQEGAAFLAVFRGKVIFILFVNCHILNFSVIVSLNEVPFFDTDLFIFI